MSSTSPESRHIVLNPKADTSEIPVRGSHKLPTRTDPARRRFLCPEAAKRKGSSPLDADGEG